MNSQDNLKFLWDFTYLCWNLAYVPQGECPVPVSSRAMVPDASKDAEARIAALEKENQRLTAELNAMQHRTAP